MGSELVPVIVYLPKEVAGILSANAKENDRSISAEARRIIVRSLSKAD